MGLKIKQGSHVDIALNNDYLYNKYSSSFRMSGQEMDMKACVAYAQLPSTQTPASHEGAEALYDNV